ncbi:MAG: glycosyltransferase family 39 protein [Chloroflexota bacterium]|nr:glycosyltransferase family 39 protein [Chloroflexota bacterium]
MMTVKPTDNSSSRFLSRSYPWVLAPMIFILLFAFGVGAHGLNADLVWNDELASLTNFGAFDKTLALHDVFGTMKQYSPADVPIYPWIGYIWARIVGWSQFALRSLSLYAGVLMIAFLFRFASSIFDRRVAVVAPFLIASNSFVLLYFHELRAYTLFMLLFTIHLTYYWKLAYEARVKKFPWLAFQLSAVVMVWTSIVSVTVIAALAVFHVLFAPKGRRWAKIVCSWAFGVLFLLPFATNFVQGVGLVTNDGLAASNSEILHAFLHLAVNASGLMWFPSLTALGYALRKNTDSNLLRLIAIALALAGLLLLMNSLFALIAVTRIRYFLVVWILLSIIFAYGMVSLPHWKAPTGVLLLIWFVAGIQFGQSADFSTYYAGAKASVSEWPPLLQMVAGLQEKVRSQDFLVGFYESHDPNYLWQVHSAGSISDYYLGAQLGIDGAFLHANLKRYRLTEDTRDILAAHPHILLAHDPSDVPLNYARALAIVSEVLAPCEKLVDEPTLSIRKYAHPVMGCEHQSAAIDYENGIRLIDRAVEFDIDGQRIQALTWWEVPDAAMLNQYNVSLQIVTSDWQNIRQTDHHLYSGLVPWSVIELSTANLPPDDYRLALILYNRENGSKVPGLDERSGESAGILPVLRFSIAA